MTWAPSVSSAMTSVSLSAAVATWGKAATSSHNAEPTRTRSRMGTRSSSGERPHSRGGRRTVSTRICWRTVLRSARGRAWPRQNPRATCGCSRTHDLGGFGNVRRGHGHPARAGRPARAVAGPRVRAEERHGGRRDRSAQAVGHPPDRPAARRHALELARPGGRSPRGRLPDEAGRPDAGRLRDLRRRRSGPAALGRVLRRLRARTRAACTICGSSTAPTCTSPAARRDFTPRNPKDDQCYRIVDVRQPTRPVEVGRWWLPGTRDGDAEPPPARHTAFDAGFRAHNTNVYPRRPDRA